MATLVCSFTHRASCLDSLPGAFSRRIAHRILFRLNWSTLRTHILTGDYLEGRFAIVNHSIYMYTTGDYNVHVRCNTLLMTSEKFWFVKFRRAQSRKGEEKQMRF